MAKKPDQRSIVQVKATIKYIRPPVWRRLQVPSDFTLADLHVVLQSAFGWEDYHLHSFLVGGKEYGAAAPESFDWGLPMADESRARLGTVLGRSVKKFVYVYDFGDDWVHEIAVEKFLPAQAETVYPRCIAGKRACPPEDCGGPWGYARLLETIGDPDHPEHEEMLEWLGDDFDPDEFGLEVVNVLLQPGPSRR